MSSQIVSPLEHNILLALALLICCFYFTNISNKLIFDYNQAVQSEQLKKQRIANGEKEFSFDLYGGYGSPLYEIILTFQFLTIPLLCLSVKRNTLAKFIFSLLLTALTLFGYISWMIATYKLREASRDFTEDNLSFNSYILFQSTVLDLGLFLAFAILFILLSTILMRFTFEKFQVKIS